MTSHAGLGLVTKEPAADRTHGTLDVVINEVHSNETRKVRNVRIAWALSPARRAKKGKSDIHESIALLISQE